MGPWTGPWMSFCGNHRWHDIRHLASVFKDGTAAICRSLWTSVFFPQLLDSFEYSLCSTWCSLQNWENDPQSCFLASFLGGGLSNQQSLASGLLSTIFENFFTFAFVLDLSMSTLCWGWTYLVKRETLDALMSWWQLGGLGLFADHLL